ncbi:YdcF family protein [Kribbella qitaiheensis]|uniref:YdcF family protein n=1 Tax=Kribbella qitaiheensis TaxID=1544730 RepID=UPI001FE4B889|nr:YdcF family protein [Kribbella qitaiheensis]
MREFAALLGVPDRTVSKWEAAGESRTPRPHMQAILDTALHLADAEAQARFENALGSTGSIDSPSTGIFLPSGNGVDVNSWADDVDRARLYADRQDFQFASRLMQRWLVRAEDARMDESTIYLKGQSLVVLGNVQRDQGILRGPHSADSVYRQALACFKSLHADRRHAQVELLTTVLAEMSGGLEVSARQYQLLADDERLGALDRARARLWIGTALSKKSRLTEDRSDATVQAIVRAIQDFETLDEPDEWSVSHQKLALAYLAAGDPIKAAEAIDIAATGHHLGSPLQQVRLSTAQAHILCSDPASRDSGFALLDQTYELAEKFGLAHQMVSIRRIRADVESTPKQKNSNSPGRKPLAVAALPTSEQLEDALLIWKYHQMGHELKSVDAAIGLGSHDLGVADYAAELYRREFFPVVVFSGGNSPTTKAKFPRGEAVHYKEHAVSLGIPETSILVDVEATNTGQNITLSKRVLAQESILPDSVMLISKPYMERRAYATCRKMWPEVQVVCASEPLKFDDYISNIGNAKLVIDMLVGDLQRVIEYPKMGFAVEQVVPEEIQGAFQRLIEAGYTSRLMS